MLKNELITEQVRFRSRGWGGREEEKVDEREGERGKRRRVCDKHTYSIISFLFPFYSFVEEVDLTQRIKK